MNDLGLQAPWVGVCREDYYGYGEGYERRGDFIGYCADCGEALHEFDEDVQEIDGKLICGRCVERRYDEEEEYDG